MRKAVACVGWFAWSLFAIGCISEEKYNELQNEYNHSKKALKDSEIYMADLEGMNKELDAKLANLNLEAEKYRRNSASADQTIGDLQKRLHQALEEAQKTGNPDWTIIAATGGFIYRILDNILFDVGKASLTARGRDVLARLSTELKKHDYSVQIEGHTDSDPVKVHIKEFPKGNIELGTERALTVWSELRKLGIAESRLSVVSHAANQPVTSNETELGKSKNRRVDVKIGIPREKATSTTQADKD